MPVRTKDQLKAELNTTFFENSGGGITPALVQTFMIDVIDSIPDAAGPSYVFSTGIAAGSGFASASTLALFKATGTAAGNASALGASPSWIGPTWSLTDHYEFITISGTDNQIATRSSTSGPATQNARSDTAQTTGARYVELTIGQLLTSNMLVGVSNGAADLGVQIGSDNNSFGYWSIGATFTNGGFGAVSPPAYGTGDVIGMNIDLDANTIAFRLNGGSFSATTSIAALRPASDPIFIIACLRNNLNDFVTITNV